MNVTITNQGNAAVPIILGTNTSGEALAIVDPGALYAVADDAATVVSVGDNPSFLEEVKESLSNIAEVLKRIAFWREQRPTPQEGDDTGVAILIENAGPNDLRVLSDANTNETFIAAGSSGVAQAQRYVEIREQGV